MIKKVLKSIFVVLACTLAATAFVSCGSGDNNKDEEKTTGVITLNVSTAKMDIYETLTLTATLKDLIGEIVWTSSDSTKAIVADGVVTSLAEGEVTVTAAVGDKSASCVVTIDGGGQIPVLNVGKESICLRESQTFTTACTLKYNGRSLNADYEYASADDSVAAIDSNGVITAVGAGDTIVTVTANRLGFSAKKTIAVKVTEDVLVETSVDEVVLGTMKTEEYETVASVSAKVTEKKTVLDNPLLVWTTDDEKVAMVDADGNITSTGAGETIVSVAYEKGNNTFAVNVRVRVEKPVFEAALTNEIVDLDANDGLQAEIDLAGINEKVVDLVNITDVNNANKKIGFTVDNGKAIINKSDVSVSKKILRLEYTKAIYEVTVVITNRHVDLAVFEKKTDADNIGLYWNTYDLSVDTEFKYETDKGSLKVTYTSEQNFSYLILSTALVTDVSLYDYISFNVYNPTDKTFDVVPAWGSGTKIAANGWTNVRVNISEFVSGKLTDMSGKLLSAENISGLAFYVSGGGWKIGESFYVSSFAAYKETKQDDEDPVAENVIAKFDKGTDAGKAGNYPGWGNFGFSVDNSVKYETEKGTLKVTVNEKSNWGYIEFSNLLIKDVSAWDYIAFNVYNPTSRKLSIQPTWGAGTEINAKGWTQVKIPVSKISELTDAGNNALSAEDITGIIFCVYYNEWEVGESFYVSSFAAYKNEKEDDPVAENVVARFDSETDLNTVWSGGNRYTPDLSIDTEKVHGEDKGSLKVTFVNENEAPQNSWVVLKTPMKKDVSEYDYISFWVYCDKECHVDLFDATAYVIPAETWTEIRISTEDLANKKTIDYVNLTAEDISNMAIYLTWCDNYRAGDSIYISSITYGNE